MNRVEAISNFINASDNAINYLDSKEVVSSDSINIIINKIYDEIENKTCEWEQTDEYEDGLIYSTECKMDWHSINCSTPKENGMVYCPRCGGKIKIKGEKEDV